MHEVAMPSFYRRAAFLLLYILRHFLLCLLVPWLNSGLKHASQAGSTKLEAE